MDVTEQAAQRIGEVIAGKYRLLELLGAGGMGAVYEAVHQFTQRRVAVKLMHPAIARSGVAAERFLREAQAPSAIGHPGIVEVLDGGHDETGALYLVLELLQGETLAQAIKRGALAPQEIGAIALELLDALDAAHGAGFVHRDIKPENVFLVPVDGPTPLVKLLDFGIAGVVSVETRSRPGLTQAGSVLGTPLYMSPEQALGRRVDARSDLWSVGAVLYQALSGRAPFAGDSFHALIVSISTEHHLPLSVLRPELPVRLCAVVERALRKDLEQRWQSAAEMADALRRALEHGHRARSAQAAPAVGPVEVRSAAREPMASERPVGARGWLLAVSVLAAIAVGAMLWTAVPGLRSTNERAVAAAAVPATVMQQTPAVTNAPTSPAPKVSPASAQPQAVAAPGALSAEGLSEVMQRHERELQRCYEDVIAATLMRVDAGAANEIRPLRLDIELDVSASGAVERVALEGDAGADMKRCATSALSSWRFPNSSAPTRVRFPVIFQPNIVQR